MYYRIILKTYKYSKELWFYNYSYHLSLLVCVLKKFSLCYRKSQIHNFEQWIYHKNNERNTTEKNFHIAIIYSMNKMPLDIV